MTTPRDEPQRHQCLTCDSCNHGEKTNSPSYPFKCLVSKPVPMMVHEYCVSWFGYVGCASHSSNTGAQNKTEGVAQISSYNYIKDIAATKGMSFYDLVDLVVDDLKAQARIDAVVKELETQIADAKKNKNYERVAGYEKAIALLKEGVGK